MDVKHALGRVAVGALLAAPISLETRNPKLEIQTMKARAEKSSTTSSAIATRAVHQPFFGKTADEGHFFAPITPNVAPAVQARLHTGQHGDHHEREADMMAERVARPTEKAWKHCCPPEEKERIQFKPLAASVTPFVPRRVQTEELLQQTKNSPESTLFKAQSESRLDDKEEPVQKQEEREEAVQAKILGNGPLQSLPAIEQSLRAHRGLGSPLPDTFLQTIEKGFGADFSGVRLHTGSQAADLSKNLRSQAFTVRNDIYFAQGKYHPATTEGKLLLAHELTHTIQQGASKALPVAKEESWAQPAFDLTDEMRSRRYEPQQKSAGEEKTETLPPEPVMLPTESKEVEKTAVEIEPVTIPPETAPEEGAPIKAPASLREDPDFQEARKQVRTEAKKQKKMLATAGDKKEFATPGDKREEAVKASALGEKEQKEQSGQEKNIAEMDMEGAKQKSKDFSADEFMKKFHELVEKQKKPRTESEVKGFAQKPPIEGFPKDISDGLSKKQDEVTKPLQEKAKPVPPVGVVGKAIMGIPKPAYPPAPKPVAPKLAIPKPKTDAEISFQSENDRLDSAMQKYRLSDEQLEKNESREPSFWKALEKKHEAQKKVAEAPGNYRQREDEILKKAEEEINTSLSTKLTGMSKIHHKKGGEILGSQEATESTTERRQGEIKEEIYDIYRKTVEDVTNILKGMAEKVKQDFANSLETQKDNFNKNINSSLKDYYSKLKKIKHFLLGEPKVVVNPDDGSTRPLTREDYDLKTFPPLLKSGIDWINPDVYKIFVKEKDKFIAGMEGELEKIANDVQIGLTMAHLRIQLGQAIIAVYKAGLKGKEREFAEKLELEVKLKFENLEDSIVDTRDQLLQTMADQYNENLNDLETKFKEINDNLKKTWVDRAIDFIETVGKTIFQLAELLKSILVRMFHLVWDIIKHPIRFFETLVKGLITAIGTFVGDIGTYLEEAFWSWITNKTASKGIRLGPGSGVEKLFGLVVQVVGISKEDLQKLVKKIFQMDIVALVEKGMAMGGTLMAEGQKLLAPVIILMRDGLGAFWNYLKDTVGGMVEGVFAKIKETVFFEFVKKGLKYIAGFFVPGGGFVKVVKAMVRAFQFVAENLDKIRGIFDSIFDSMEAAVEGRTAGVVSKIIIGLKTGVVLALDFLARQLGLDTILDKVQKLFQDLRKRILQAIEWVLRQVRTGLEKIGFFKWLDTLKKEAAAAGKKAVGAVLRFFGIKKYFSTNTGERHALYFEKRGGKTVLLIESTAQDIRKFVDFYVSERKLDANKMQLVSQILSHLESYKDEYAELKKVGETSEKAKPIHERLLQKNVALGELLRTLLSGDRKIGMTIESYLLEGLTGTYSSMPRPPMDILTPDHQPQAAILKWAEDLKVPGSRRKVYSSSSDMANRARGSHASGGYAINLHEIRHIKGKTFASEGEKTKKAFIKFITENIAGEADDQKIRNIITERMKKELKGDVAAMRTVIGGKNWADIDEITDLNITERQKLKVDIEVQITKGLGQIENQPMDTLKDY